MHKFVTALIILVKVACAFPQYRSEIPNAFNFPAIGHVNPNGGGDRNEFGVAFANNNRVFTNELCKADSDGDGVSNGAELGDPCCVWSTVNNNNNVAGQLITEGLSHPGLASDVTNNPLLVSPSCQDNTITSQPATTQPIDTATTEEPTTAPPVTTTEEPTNTIVITAEPVLTTAGPSQVPNSSAAVTLTFTVVTTVLALFFVTLTQ